MASLIKGTVEPLITKVWRLVVEPPNLKWEEHLLGDNLSCQVLDNRISYLNPIDYQKGKPNPKKSLRHR